MARKTQVLTIAAAGRDEGKTFLLTEMAATRAEKWATRALLALARSGTDLPVGAQGLGMSAVAAIGLRAFTSLSFDDAEPLLDEMMTCVQVVPDPARPQVVRGLIAEDVEEVRTLLQLRSEVFALHVGFSIADELSKLRATSANPPSQPSTFPPA